MVELDQLISRLVRHLGRHPFADTSAAGWRPGASLALVQKPGYREAYRILRGLIDLLEMNGTAIRTSVKNIEALYEAWCFIHVGQLLRAAFPDARVTSHLLRDRDRGLGVGIAYGAYIKVTTPDRTITATYNQQWAGLTGNQRPDITVRIDVPGWPHLDLVVDAKYRVNHTEKYVKQWGAPGPPREAVDVCHRYRDSIVDPATAQRHTVRAVAAFPLNASDSLTFGQHRMFKAIASQGIGALPLLPGNTVAFDSWLRETVAATPEVLANFGPEFAGAAHAASLKEPVDKHPPDTASTGQ